MLKTCLSFLIHLMCNINDIKIEHTIYCKYSAHHPSINGYTILTRFPFVKPTCTMRLLSFRRWKIRIYVRFVCVSFNSREIEGYLRVQFTQFFHKEIVNLIQIFLFRISIHDVHQCFEWTYKERIWRHFVGVTHFRGWVYFLKIKQIVGIVIYFIMMMYRNCLWQTRHLIIINSTDCIFY